MECPKKFNELPTVFERIRLVLIYARFKFNISKSEPEVQPYQK